MGMVEYVLYPTPHDNFSGIAQRGCSRQIRDLSHLSSFSFFFLFTKLHVMQTRYCDENSVCLSVCLSVHLSVCHRRGLWQNGRKIGPDFYTIYERTFSLVFWEEKWLVEATPSRWNFGSTDPHWNEIADFQPIVARSSSAVTPSEKSLLTLIGRPLRAFQWA